MVESKEPEIEERKAEISNEIVNFDQLVHLKAYQEGYLQYDKKYKRVKGRIWGQRSKLHRFDETSSFLPFTPINESASIVRYRSGETFTELPRPYLPGYQEQPKDDGSRYDAKADELKS